MIVKMILKVTNYITTYLRNSRYCRMSASSYRRWWRRYFFLNIAWFLWFFLRLSLYELVIFSGDNVFVLPEENFFFLLKVFQLWRIRKRVIIDICHVLCPQIHGLGLKTASNNKTSTSLLRHGTSSTSTWQSYLVQIEINWLG